jgi:hypothetical protein
MDYRETLRVLKKSNLVTKSLLDKAELKSVSREEILGLEYRGGEEVIDSVTGRRGRIDAGSTAYITKV